MKRMNRRERGFSLIETVIVLAIILIFMAFAVVQTRGSLESYKANAAMHTVSGQLRVARQLAISQRRTVQITFNTALNPPTISYQVKARFGVPGDVDGPVVTMPLPGQTMFVAEAGVPDTPMGFGTCAGNAVCIGGVGGGPPAMYFSSTGQFSDQFQTTTYNGTFFIGILGEVATARAVTIMGNTGRVRPYTFIGPVTGTPTQVWIE